MINMTTLWNRKKQVEKVYILHNTIYSEFLNPQNSIMYYIFYRSA